MKSHLSLSHNPILFLLVGLLLTLGVISCEQDSYDNLIEGKPQTVKLTASLENEATASTRTVLGQDGSSILWTAADKIKVFTKSELGGAIFESTNNEPSKKADFEGLLDITGIYSENPIVAVYPYADDTAYDGTDVTISFPSKQEAIADGFSDHLLPALAVSSNLNLSFYQVATGIRFMVTTEGVKKVIFRGNKGETVAGRVKIAMNDEGRPIIKEVVEESQWVTLEAPENGTFEVGKMYYLSVLPNNFEAGFTLNFLTDTVAARFEFEAPVTFKRAIWKNGKNLEEGLAYTTKQLTNGIPIVEINVEDGAPVATKETWLNCKVRIGEDYYDTVTSTGKVRGRGNATWTACPKKPYRIKFSSKEKPFGFPANKDWVLLAEYNDKSLLRTAYMSEISKVANADFSINYQHVNLFLNGEYLGVYVLTDQVKVGKHRIEIEDDGFFIEEDLYYSKEPLWFSTSQGFNFTFKYPDADDGEIVEGDDNYVFISGFINNLENAFSNIDNAPDAVSSVVDYSSFSKWYLIQELMQNWEPNRFFVLPSRTSKLKMCPAWDAEWSMGLAKNGNNDSPYGWFFLPTEPDFEATAWRGRQYFKWLFLDPLFISVLKDEWQEMKPKLNIVSINISSVISKLETAQGDNFDKWPILDEITGAGLIALGSWEAEVNYVNSFFLARIEWMDNYISNL